MAAAVKKSLILLAVRTAIFSISLNVFDLGPTIPFCIPFSSAPTCPYATPSRRHHVFNGADAAQVIVVGAGMAGISAARVLAKAGITDILILEGTDIIGGRMRSFKFEGNTVELGANWVEGVGGEEINPVDVLATKVKLLRDLSELGNYSRNTYDKGGYVSPSLTVPIDERFSKFADFGAARAARLGRMKAEDESVLTAQRLAGLERSTPLEMVIDFWYCDWEFAEPPRSTSLKATGDLSTFAVYGDESWFVHDPRGYVEIVHSLAQDFLKHKTSSDGSHVYTDERILFHKVVTHVKYSTTGVTVSTEDGSVYSAPFAIITASLGVLQSDLISFHPPLPAWKRESLNAYNMGIFTKIFLKFPKVFWPTGPGTDFMLYASSRRGYYPVWAHFESVFPGSHILMVVVTDDESKRVEQQSDEATLAEVMDVLRQMFGKDIPDATAIKVPRWWSDRLFRGSFSNWPIGLTHLDFVKLQLPLGRLYFSGEHVSENFNGYVQGALEDGERAANLVLDCLKENKKCAKHATRLSRFRKTDLLKGGSCSDFFKGVVLKNMADAKAQCDLAIANATKDCT